MKKMKKVFIVILTALLILSGCGDDGDSNRFTGMYEMTDIKESNESCNEADLVKKESFGSYAFFRVTVESFFGQKFLSLSDCNSGTDCSNQEEDTIDITNTFTTSGQDSSDGVWCWGTAPKCHCSQTIKTLELVDGILTWREQTEETDITIPEGDECGDHENDTMTLTCSSLKISTAKKLD